MNMKSSIFSNFYLVIALTVAFGHQNSLDLFCSKISYLCPTPSNPPLISLKLRIKLETTSFLEHVEGLQGDFNKSQRFHEHRCQLLQDTMHDRRGIIRIL